MEKMGKRAIGAAVLVVLALVSLFGGSRVLSSPDTYQATLASLEEKQTTVLELTAASAAASAGLSMLPGDTATPIAEKLADLSGYFLVALCAIYLEKYLLTITGFAACTVLFPLACGALILYLLTQRGGWKELGKRFALLGAVVCLVVPVSEKLSGMIEDTYAASIQQTVDLAKNASQEAAQEETADSGEETGGLLSGLYSKVTDAVKESVSGVTRRAENLLSRFMEALAVTLITCCAIPVLVILFFVWLVKLVLGLDLRRKNEKTT